MKNRVACKSFAGTLWFAAAGLFAPQILAQSKAASTPQFEAASIKAASPSVPRPGRMGAAIVTTPGLLTARNANLKELIEAAYAIEDYQVSGGPGWLASARFDVEAKPTGRADRDELLLMLRPFLADRFKLAFHRETKDLPIYALVVMKNGPKFHASKAGADEVRGKTNHLRLKNLPALARYLTRFGSDKQVIDKTGLTGDFDIELDIEKVLESMTGGQTAGEPHSIGSMFDATANAIQDQLGLKLAPTKALVELLVIDHAEKPSAN